MTLTDWMSARIPPDAAITNAAHRALLGLCAPRARRADDRASQALSRALLTTALGRFPAQERDWIRRIEARRGELARDHAAREGSQERWSPPRVWSIPRVWGRFLLRLVSELAPRSCIELGAGFGMSALYQAAALEVNGSGHLSTLDREPSLIPIARDGFAQLGLDRRAELIGGPIEETLPGVARRHAPIDYAFIDADHTEEATVAGFDALRPHLRDRALVVFDDILESEEMERAWRAVQGRPGIIRALNLRRLGVTVVSAQAR